MRCVVFCGSPSFPWLQLGNVDMLQPVSLSGRRRSEDWKPSTFEWKAAQIFATSFLTMAIKSTNYKDENTGNSFRITPSNHTGRTRTNAVGLHITKKLLTNYVHLTESKGEYAPTVYGEGILPDHFKSDCGPAKKREKKVQRFAKSVLENCCCELPTLHNVI